MSSRNKVNTFRIIAGEWRSRRFELSPNSQLRPTPDRVRETLFNWLGHEVRKAICLDLFAGSGALGLEALSRGAASCAFVEAERSSAQQIEKTLAMLQVNSVRASVLNELAEKFIHVAIEKQQTFDLVFLDPPFQHNWWQKLCPHLEKITHAKSLIYLEVEKECTKLVLPENWCVFREKTAGQVRYYLLTRQSDNQQPDNHLQ